LTRATRFIRSVTSLTYEKRDDGTAAKLGHASHCRAKFKGVSKGVHNAYVQFNGQDTIRYSLPVSRRAGAVGTGGVSIEVGDFDL